MRYLLAIVLSLLPLTLGQTPFPGYFNIIPSNQSIAFRSSIASYTSSLARQPAYTAFSLFMATATNLSSAESMAFHAADNNPVLLAYDFVTATATPAWYTEIPAPFQSYVSSIASVGASMHAMAAAANEAERVEVKVTVMGSLLATMLVGMFLL